MNLIGPGCKEIKNFVIRPTRNMAETKFKQSIAGHLEKYYKELA